MEFFSAGVFDQVQTMSEGFTGGSDSKESACNAADLGSIPGSGRSPGEENGYQLQNSCLRNSMDRGAWRATVHRIEKNGMQLSDLTHFTFKIVTNVFSFFSDFILFFYFTILHWFCHTSTWICHRCTRVPQSWTLLPPPSPYHLSGSSQCTSPMHPVFCIEPGLVIRFLYDIFQA